MGTFVVVDSFGEWCVQRVALLEFQPFASAGVAAGVAGVGLVVDFVVDHVDAVVGCTADCTAAVDAVAEGGAVDDALMTLALLD